jgi:hypothetical protein
MTSGNRATAMICLACATALCGGPSRAAEATVRWHPVTNDSPLTAFALNPANPTTTNVISFVAPTDGKIYINDCFASLDNGSPAIAVAATNQTITVSFSAPLTDSVCPLIVAPVSGVDGHFGPLSAGTWVFDILQNAYTFSVAEAPLPLSIQAFTDSSTFQLAWPVSGNLFVLEFKDGLAPGNWQVVTNPPTTLSNRNTVQLHADSGTRFFRLRRLPP